MKLSVIIPTCNRIDRIGRSVESIKSQKIDDEIEIIVVDDSKKTMVEDLTRMFQHDACVKVVRNQSHGPSQARNLGVKHARGKYICFLDDDDMYLPGRLNNMLSFMDDNSEYSFVSSGRLLEINDFESIELIGYQNFGIIDLSNNLYENYIDIGIMLRKDLFIEVGGFDEKLTSLEDWDLILRLLKISNGYKLKRLDYAVNIDPNRERVSKNQYVSRRKLACKHHNDFGTHWYITMLTQAKSREKSLTFIEIVSNIFAARDLRLIKWYIKSKVR